MGKSRRGDFFLVMVQQAEELSLNGYENCIERVKQV